MVCIKNSKKFKESINEFFINPLLKKFKLLISVSKYGKVLLLYFFSIRFPYIFTCPIPYKICLRLIIPPFDPEFIISIKLLFLIFFKYVPINSPPLHKILFKICSHNISFLLILIFFLFFSITFIAISSLSFCDFLYSSFFISSIIFFSLLYLWSVGRIKSLSPILNPFKYKNSVVIFCILCINFNTSLFL